MSVKKLGMIGLVSDGILTLKRAPFHQQNTDSPLGLPRVCEQNDLAICLN